MDEVGAYYRFTIAHTKQQNIGKKIKILILSFVESFNLIIFNLIITMLFF